ncbi:MAG: hypothetical protein AAF907_02035, partial [Planctomycetota bacterium]
MRRAAGTLARLLRPAVWVLAASGWLLMAFSPSNKTVWGRLQLEPGQQSVLRAYLGTPRRDLLDDSVAKWHPAWLMIERDVRLDAVPEQVDERVFGGVWSGVRLATSVSTGGVVYGRSPQRITRLWVSLWPALLAACLFGALWRRLASSRVATTKPAEDQRPERPATSLLRRLIRPWVVVPAFVAAALAAGSFVNVNDDPKTLYSSWFAPATEAGSWGRTTASLHLWFGERWITRAGRVTKKSGSPDFV